jgi:hypothetical protein
MRRMRRMRRMRILLDMEPGFGPLDLRLLTGDVGCDPPRFVAG